MDRKVTFYSEGTPCVGIVGVPDDYKPGDQRGAVIFCQGFTGVKEMYLPDNAKRLQAEGYVTLNFDYRYFGEWRRTTLPTYSDGTSRRYS